VKTKRNFVFVFFIANSFNSTDEDLISARNSAFLLTPPAAGLKEIRVFEPQAKVVSHHFD
jgi:hypothetical protein